jgi:isopenicillin-N N-acyltransferase-like protein
MSCSGFRFVEVSGSPYERGFKYGSIAGDLVRMNIDYYFSFWKRRFNIDGDLILRKSEEIKSAVEKFDPSLIEEMKGIADGANVNLNQVTALNARYELMWVMLPRFSCTSVALLSEVTVNKHVFLGQNWDYKPAVLDTNVILLIKCKDGPNILTHVEAGCLSRIGLNSEGIGLCVNAVVSSQDKFEPKIPFHVLCRSILSSRSLSEGIEGIIKSERAVSYNFLVASRENVVINLEVLPKKFNYIFPSDGFIIHTNHFLKVNEFEDKFIEVVPDTLVRFERAKRILKENIHRSPIDHTVLIRIFRDHFNYPNSICRHRDPRLSEDDQIETLSSIIMDLNELKILITKGQPCINEYSQVYMEK